MSEKVKTIYVVWENYEKEVEVVEAPVLRETPKLYWVKENWPAFRTTKIWKGEAHTTRKEALIKYREILAGEIRYNNYKLSVASDALDEFNAQFKEELS